MHGIATLVLRNMSIFHILSIIKFKGIEVISIAGQFVIPVEHINCIIDSYLEFLAHIFLNLHSVETFKRIWGSS